MDPSSLMVHAATGQALSKATGATGQALSPADLKDGDGAGRLLGRKELVAGQIQHVDARFAAGQQRLHQVAAQQAKAARLHTWAQV